MRDRILAGMSDRPAYFVVMRGERGTRTAIFWDELPREGVRNLEYVLRLDEQPDAERLLATPVDLLHRLYLHRKANGTLPPRWESPKKQTTAKPAEILLGHRESPRDVVERSRQVHPED